MDTGLSNTFGRCRFCNAEGNHKEIMKEYKQNGFREIYFDIFQECFNLYLCIMSNQSKLICTSCIKQLKDANDFRLMVMQVEKELTAKINQEPEFISLPENNETDWTKPTEEKDNVDQLKVEVESVTGDELDYDDDDELCDDITISSEHSDDDESVRGEHRLLSRFSKENLKPLPTRQSLYTTCKTYVKHLDSLNGKLIAASAIKMLLEKQKKTSKLYLTEKAAINHNITTLLQFSNMAPFKPKRRAGIICYYCSNGYNTFEKLHDHQNENNCNKSLKAILNKACAENLIIYAHVKELKCTICDVILESLNGLKTHLIAVHKKTFYTQYSDRVVPFKQLKGNDYQCQMCGFNFETFGSIERHMNVHFRNYACDKCGAGYMTKNRLKVHWRYSHGNGVFPCDLCKKVYPSQHKFNCHYDIVHRSVKKNRCTKCPARFADYFNKHKHMVDVHGEPPLEYRCNVCDAVFRRRYALHCHVRRRHLESKDVQCSLCAYKCYTRTELKVHMVKHVGERSYQCTVCKKSYARKKTLKEHMRIHENDRRYVCAICGQGFVQNCSLKGHMRAHHAGVADLGRA